MQIGEKAGLEMVRVDVDISSVFYTTINAISSGSFVKKMVQTLKGEEIIGDYSNIVLKERLPAFLVQLVGWYRNKDPQRFRRLLVAVINNSLQQLVKSLEAVEAAKRTFEAMMIEQRLDGWLLPAGAFPAIRHAKAADLLGSITYPMFFNLLHFPAGMIPITRVREDEQDYACEFDDLATAQGKLTMQQSAGLPVGVQIGCKPFKDELVLSIMKRFEEVMGKTECFFA